MTRLLPSLLASLLLLSCTAASAEAWEPQVGDLVFHTSTSRQSEAVRAATRSQWSHVGMVVKDGKSWAVIEAVQPVRVVPLTDFLDRGVDRKYEARRTKTPLSEQQAAALSQAARSFEGRDYDLYFGWDDELIYCSELIWKAYSNGLGIDLSTPRALSDFDLNSPAVAALMKKRWPGGVPADVAVSPQDLAESSLLERVGSR